MCNDCSGKSPGKRLALTEPEGSPDRSKAKRAYEDEDYVEEDEEESEDEDEEEFEEENEDEEDEGDNLQAQQEKAKAIASLPEEERPDPACDQEIDPSELASATTIPDSVFEQMKTPIQPTKVTENTKRFDRWYGKIFGAIMDHGAKETGPIDAGICAPSMRRWFRLTCVCNSRQKIIAKALSAYPNEYKEEKGKILWTKEDEFALFKELSLSDQEFWGTYGILGVKSDDLADLQPSELIDFDPNDLEDDSPTDVCGYKGQTRRFLRVRREEHFNTVAKGNDWVVESRSKPNGRCLSAYLALTQPNTGVLFGPISKFLPILRPGYAKFHLSHILFVMETAEVFLDKTWMPAPGYGGLSVEEIYAKIRPADMPTPISTQGLNSVLPISQGVRGSLSPKDVRILKTAVESYRLETGPPRNIKRYYYEHAKPAGYSMAYDAFRKQLQRRWPDVFPVRRRKKRDKDAICANPECEEKVNSGRKDHPLEGPDGNLLCSPCGARYQKGLRGGKPPTDTTWQKVDPARTKWQRETPAEKAERKARLCGNNLCAERIHPEGIKRSAYNGPGGLVICEKCWRRWVNCERPELHESTDWMLDLASQIAARRAERAEQLCDNEYCRLPIVRGVNTKAHAGPGSMKLCNTCWIRWKTDKKPELHERTDWMHDQASQIATRKAKRAEQRCSNPQCNRFIDPEGKGIYACPGPGDWRLCRNCNHRWKQRSDDEDESWMKPHKKSLR